MEILKIFSDFDQDRSAIKLLSQKRIWFLAFVHSKEILSLFLSWNHQWTSEISPQEPVAVLCVPQNFQPISKPSDLEKGVYSYHNFYLENIIYFPENIWYTENV